MAYPDSVARVTPNPGGSLTASKVTAGMRKEMIDQELRLQMTLDDVFVNFSSPVIEQPDGMDVPNAVMLRLGADAKKGTHSITIGMTTPYTGSFIVGDQYIPGNEVADELRYAKFYYGEYAFAAAKDNYGRTANEMDYFNAYAKQNPKMAHFVSEQKGIRIREALLETYDYVVVDDANSGVTAKRFNPNWFIANADPTLSPAAGSVDSYGQPVATSVAGSAFTELIADVMVAAATGTNGVDANISLENLRDLAYYARTVKHIEPLDNGKYVLMIPGSQVKTFLGLTADGGTIIQALHRKEGDNVSYTYKLTEVENMEIYVDDRFPTIQQGGIDGSYTLTTKYLPAGNATDDRYLTPAATNWHIGFLMGKAAFAEWVVTAEHWEVQKSNYDKREGNGVFGESGFGLVEYDNDDGFAAIEAADGVRTQIGSIVCAWTAA